MCTCIDYSGTSDKGHSDKGHNRNNLPTKDKVHCTKWRHSYSSKTFLISNKGQPGQNGQKTMGPKRVRYSCISLLKLYIHMHANR